MAPPSPVQTAPPPVQLPLPLAPSPTARPPAVPTAPGQVWASLSATEREACRQTLVAVLRQVVHDGTE